MTQIQQPIQRWLVLTEFGIELEPTGCRPIADQFANAVRPYRRLCSVVTETRYEEVRT